MKIGVGCFLDEQLSSMVKRVSKSGECDIRHKQNEIIYDTQVDHYLEDYLEEIIDIFIPAKYIDADDSDERIDYLKNVLERWKIFSVKADDIQIIIQAICKKRYQDEIEIFTEKVTIREFFSKKEMERNCILKNYSWDRFCHVIKHENRFHSQQINFVELKKLLANMAIDVPKGTLELYRSRICDKDHYSVGFSANEMGAPPENSASSGRTNSEGIQCLYLANNENTTFHEVRARIRDHLSVGKFKQKNDLKIVDFSLFDSIGPFSIPDFDMTWFAINIEIIRKMGDEVARPMRRFDSALDYIPTQYICDYIKCLGYHGIKFKSTLVTNGINYAIFNQKNFECVETKFVQINNMEYRVNAV